MEGATRAKKSCHFCSEEAVGALAAAAAGVELDDGNAAPAVGDAAAAAAVPAAAEAAAAEDDDEDDDDILNARLCARRFQRSQCFFVKSPFASLINLKRVFGGN